MAPPKKHQRPSAATTAPEEVGTADPGGTSAYHRVAPTSLPCCLRPALQVLFYDMLTPDDGFVDTIRKGTATAVLFIGILIPVAVLSNHTSPRATVAGIAYMVVTAMCSASWILTYVAVRCCKTRALPAVTAGFAVNLLGVSLSVVCAADYPFPLVFMLMMITVGILNLSYRWLWYALIAPAYFVASYNWAAKSNASLDFTAVLLEGSDPYLPLEARMGPWVVAYVISLILSLVISMLHDEFARQIESANASATLSALVSHKLATYNTEDARVILSAANEALDHGGTDETITGDGDDDDDVSASVKGADSALVESLTAIVENLEAYRPHLPNWMLDAALAGRRRDRLGVDDESTTITTASSHNRLGEDTISNRSQHSRRRRSDPTASEGGGPSTVTPNHHAPSDTVRHVSVARARVHFAVKARPSSHRALAAVAASAFVDAVYAAARSTKAAVHSFVGDTVEVSWNAAACVASPAGKAARFLATLDAAVAKAASQAANAAVTVTRVGGGAVVSKARIQMAGGGMQQALLLNVAPQHERALATLAAAGAAHACMLVSAAVAAEGLDVVSCPVATYDRVASTTVPPEAITDRSDMPVPNPESSHTDRRPATHEVAHVILRQRNAAEDADEWLYVLQRGGGADPNAPADPMEPGNVSNVVSRAFADAIDGRLHAACESLAPFADESSDDGGGGGNNGPPMTGSMSMVRRLASILECAASVGAPDSVVEALRL